ncbi:MAG: phage portal protein [Ruthenibacterium sp.]
MIREYFAKRGFTLPCADWYKQIGNYLDWYEGDVASFHKYSVFNGTAMVRVKRYALGMAKVIAEDHANLLLNEKVKITAEQGFDETLQALLAANNFRVQGNNLVELAFALGTGAFVEYINGDGSPTIDYIRADMIYPLSYDNGTITECAFASVKTCDGVKAFYLQIHRLICGKYTIENVYLDAENGKKLPLPEGIRDIVQTGSPVPLFQIVRPNIVNNYDLDNPMGMSVYGNAIDQLKGCDLIWDSYMNEFTLGRKRIMVPLSMAKIEMSKAGETTPLFDPNDTTFYVYQQDTDGKNELKEVNMSIRAEQHELGLQRVLNLLSKKCGLGNDRYRFDGGGGIKTATEVISEKSELFQNLKKNELLLESALIGLVKALAFLSGRQPDIEVHVAFDDSIIEDHTARIDDHIKLTGAGLESKLAAIMDIKKCSEADAQKELKRINDENMMNATPDDLYPPHGGDANDNTTG